MPDFASAIPARLDGYTLAFDVPSRFWDGFVATPIPAPGRAIEGLALPVPAAARGLVDHKEGAISGLFEPFEADVTPLADPAPIRALIYRAAPSPRLPRPHTPSPQWL